MLSTQDISLQTNLCGLLAENPFFLASAPPTSQPEMIKRAFNLGWGGAVIKTITPDNVVIDDVPSRFAILRNKDGSVLGFENIELLSKRSVKEWIVDIHHLKNEFPTKLLIGSIMAPLEKIAWQNLAENIAAAGIDAIELNLSCPHGMPEQGMGHSIGQNSIYVKQVTNWVKSVVDIPVFVKLTPNVTDIATIAKAATEGGADAIVAINTVQSLISIDLNTLMPEPNVHGQTTFGGLSGPAIKPLGLRAVAQIAKAINIPIIATGGISNWQDAAEYLAVGATAVEITTAVMLNDYKIINDLCQGLSSYLKRQQLTTPKQLTGIVLPKIIMHAKLSRKPMYPVIDSKKRIRCGKCVRSCRDGANEALHMQGKFPEINQKLCDGCGLCTKVCPANAITLKPR